MPSESNSKTGLETRATEAGRVSTVSARLDGHAASIHKTCVVEQHTKQASQRKHSQVFPLTGTRSGTSAVHWLRVYIASYLLETHISVESCTEPLQSNHFKAYVIC